jgi:ABC-2 type transport system permease protein
VKRWIVFKAAWSKALIEGRRYIFNTVAGVITLYLVFLLLFYGVKFLGGAGARSSDTLEGMVVGYIVWMLALLTFQDPAWGISMEAEMGTLEQLCLSPVGFAWVNASFMIARLAVNLVLLALIVVLAMLTTGRWLNLDLLSLTPLVLITVTGPYGFGFAMAGLALVFKRIQSAFQIFQFVFVACVAVPVTGFAWAKYAPLALGTHLIRRVMTEGAKFWELPAADILTATLVGAGYLVFGLVFFGYCMKAARNKGLLGQY